MGSTIKRNNPPMMALVFPPDFFFCSGSTGIPWEAGIVSAGGITGVEGISLSDVANPASAEGSAFAEAMADTSTDGGGTSNRVKRDDHV